MANLAERFISSMQGLLGKAPERVDVTGEQLDSIREIMLDALGPVAALSFPHVERRILFARDVQALWYARADLMAVLSEQHGERAAHAKMEPISHRFKGLLPTAMTQSRRRIPGSPSVR